MSIDTDIDTFVSNDVTHVAVRHIAQFPHSHFGYFAPGCVVTHRSCGVSEMSQPVEQ